MRSDDNFFPAVMNVEEEFARRGIQDTPYTRLCIEKIENGKYLDNLHFIDRFGNTLYINCLSTGCKAATLVPKCVVDLVECGANIRNFIINNCTEGTIIMYYPQTHFPPGKCDVEVCGFRFTDMERLDDYFWSGEWPNYINWNNSEGIEIIKD